MNDVTLGDVQRLLQSIGNGAVAVANAGNVFWLFAQGEISAWDRTHGNIFGVSYISNTAQPNAAATLASLQAVGNNGVLTMQGNPCRIDFSRAAWFNNIAPTGDGSGCVTLTVTIATGYTGLYDFPEDDDELRRVTIRFTPDNAGRWA